METHERFMREALKEAQKAFDAKEVPVGCVVVCQGVVIGRGHNLTERLTDATAHAEMQAITAAANPIGGKYLSECTLSVTLEPCVMCAGAIFWSQLGGLVWGASDEKRGFSKISPTIIHPKTEVTKGLLAEESEKLLKDFFKKLR